MARRRRGGPAEAAVRATLAELAGQVGGDEGRYLAYLLAHGRAFAARTPSARVPAADAWRRAHRPKAKGCYHAAQMFVLDCPDAEYYEGFAAAAGLLVAHAWEAADPEGADGPYLGLRVPREFVGGELARRRAAGPVGRAYALRAGAPVRPGGSPGPATGGGRLNEAGEGRGPAASPRAGRRPGADRARGPGRGR